LKFLHLFFIFSLFSISLNAYESEDKLKVVIVGKVAKYITFKDNNETTFKITVLNNQCKNLFDNVYKNKKIKSKPVEIIYIDKIDNLKSTDILYISKMNTINLQKILQKINGKNIFTVSDMRGFAQRGGILQFYFHSQKLKLKMNTDILQKEGFGANRTLLRIVDIVKEKR
jgi:hypothetical protein